MNYSGKQSQEKRAEIDKEVKFLKELNHLNCIKYKGCYLKDYTAWLIMEYCLGSASDLLEVHKKALNEYEISTIMLDTLNALDYIHSKGYIHRDIKAGNILLTDDGLVKLADFGSISLTSPANSFVGTPYWIAPEVILAMDEGQYDIKIDIWSLGITCIELAERKPPLYNMNAMSALYHIAQNDSPTLNQQQQQQNQNQQWSQEFIDFVNKCLLKNPLDRPLANELLKHKFILNYSDRKVLIDLIRKTKEHVRELDNLQYRKMKKIIMCDTNTSTSTSTSNATTNSHNNIPNNNNNDDIISHTSECSSSQIIEDINNDDLSSSQIGDYDDELNSNNNESSTINSTTSSIQSIQPRQEKQHQHQSISSSINDNNYLIDIFKKQQQQQNQQHKLITNGFSTIKTPKTIITQQEQVTQRDQQDVIEFQNLKRQHTKLLKELEIKLKQELEELKKKSEKEYNQQVQQYTKELDILCIKHQKDLEERQKYDLNEEKKLMQSIKELNSKELKHYINDLTHEYKRKKEDAKKTLQQQQQQLNNSKERDEHLKLIKEKLQIERKQKEDDKRKLLDLHLQEEYLKLKRKHLQLFHKLQLDINKQEIKQQKEITFKRHNLLKTHLNLTYSLKEKHLNLIQKSKQEYLDNEIKEELTSFTNYSSRRKRDLKKKHAYETKQHPKQLKQQEANIRKLYKHQYQTQNKQYKQYKEQILLQTPKELQKERLEEIKKEQNRKFSFLYEHYKTNVDAVYQQQNLKLTSTQQQEQDALNDDLDRQLSVLLNSHKQRKLQQLDSFNKEKDLLLQDKLIKFKELDDKINLELIDLDNINNNRLIQLIDTQRLMLEHFDKECFDKHGINTNNNLNSNRSSIYFNIQSSASSSPLPNIQQQLTISTDQYQHQITSHAPILMLATNSSSNNSQSSIICDTRVNNHNQQSHHQFNHRLNNNNSNSSSLSSSTSISSSSNIKTNRRNSTAFS